MFCLLSKTPALVVNNHKIVVVILVVKIVIGDRAGSQNKRKAVNFM